MKPVKMSDNNAWFGADEREVRPISVTQWINDNGDPVISTGWMPSEEELKRINEGHPIILDIQGFGMPPVFIRVYEPE